MSILQEAQAIQEEIVGWRRYFHQHPELGMDLPVTAAKVKEVLDSLGVSYREVVPNGIIATIGKPGGKSILLRGIWIRCPWKRKPACPSPLKTLAACMPAATIPTPPCCWAPPNC